MECHVFVSQPVVLGCFLALGLCLSATKNSPALWDLGCSVPALVNLQAMEEARTNALRLVSLALDAAESSAANNTDQPDFPHPTGQ